MVCAATEAFVVSTGTASDRIRSKQRNRFFSDESYRGVVATRELRILHGAHTLNVYARFGEASSVPGTEKTATTVLRRRHANIQKAQGNEDFGSGLFSLQLLELLIRPVGK